MTNPLLAFGLTMSRDQTVQPAETNPSCRENHINFAPADAWSGGDGLPLPDQAAYLRRWDEGTRFHLLCTEMLSGLEFETGKAGHCTLSVRDRKRNSQTLLKLKRPPRSSFDVQLQKVFARVGERADRSAEILTQVAPQYAYWASICNLHPARTPWTIELTTAALHVSMLVCQRIKHVLVCPRPNEYSPLIQPMVLTPTYSAFPSGHATEAYMFAFVMRAVLQGAGQGVAAEATVTQLLRVAKRIADNRVVAGLHFPIDTVGGYVLAHALAQHLLARAQGHKVEGARLDGRDIPADWDESSPTDGLDKAWTQGESFSAPASSMLRYALERARAEFGYGA